jgi:hypothetical protein
LRTIAAISRCGPFANMAGHTRLTSPSSHEPAQTTAR